MTFPQHGAWEGQGEVRPAAEGTEGSEPTLHPPEGTRGRTGACIRAAGRDSPRGALQRVARGTRTLTGCRTSSLLQQSLPRLQLSSKRLGEASHAGGLTLFQSVRIVHCPPPASPSWGPGLGHHRDLLMLGVRGKGESGCLGGRGEEAQVIALGSHVRSAPGSVQTDGQGLDPAVPPRQGSREAAGST